MVRREVQIAEETRQKQSQRDARRQTLVKEQAAKKADRETGKTILAATVLLWK
jgi:hypothetical protein